MFGKMKVKTQARAWGRWGEQSIKNLKSRKRKLDSVWKVMGSQER